VERRTRKCNKKKDKMKLDGKKEKRRMTEAKQKRNKREKNPDDEAEDGRRRREIIRT